MQGNQKYGKFCGMLITSHESHNKKESKANQAIIVYFLTHGI